MTNLISQHKIVSALVVVVLIGAAWWEFTGSPASPVLSTTVANGSNSQDSDIVSTLLKLQAVTLNGTVLSDPGFLSLQDFTTQVISAPLGRPNPFAPVSPGASSASSSEKVSPSLFAPAKH